MRSLGIAVVPLCVALLVAPSARAQQDQYADRLVAPEEAPAARTQAAAGAPMRLRMPPPTGPAELRAALQRSRDDVRACLLQRLPGRAASARARVRIDLSHRLDISLTVRPDDAGTRACVETAIRRWVQPIQSQPISRPVSAMLHVRTGAGPIVVPPPHHPPPPPPPPPPPGQYDESHVHAALDAMRASLIECVPDVSAGIVGRITLRLSVRPDGSLVLVGVSLPSGVRGPGSLGCLQSRVAWLRVPAPPGERPVVHHVELGR